jgi:hypothetical protein
MQLNVLIKHNIHVLSTLTCGSFGQVPLAVRGRPVLAQTGGISYARYVAPLTRRTTCCTS